MLTLSWTVVVTQDSDGPCVAVEVWSEEEEYRGYRDFPVLHFSVYRYKSFEPDSEVTWLVKGTGLKGISHQVKGSFPHETVWEALDTTHSPLEAELISSSLADTFSLLLSTHPEAFSLREDGGWVRDMAWRDRLMPTAALVMDFNELAPH